MKILFFHPNFETVRKSNLSYSALEHESGFSGTETALLEICHYLVSKGHHIQIVGSNESYVDDGIEYISDLDKVDYDVDWYCPLCYVGHQYEPSIHTRLNFLRTKFLLWFHFFIHDNWIEGLNWHFFVYGQYVSKYVAKEYSTLISSERSWTLGNGLSKIFIESVVPSVERKRGNWIFHSTFSRGGAVACSVFQTMHTLRPVSAKKMNLLSYYTPDSPDVASGDCIEFHGSKPKHEVCNLLLHSDYFVYPLVMPSTEVTHDTFATVILEALACGCIVLVWDVACISNIYSDYVVKLPVPAAVQQTYNPCARRDHCPWMQSDEAKQLFIDAILQLEDEPVRKEHLRSRGIEWARQFRWADIAFQMEEKLLANI